MRKVIMSTGILLLFLFSVVQINPASAAEIITEEIIEELNLIRVDFIKTADNFVILFDSSSSMKKKYPGTDKTALQVAKELLRERNENNSSARVTVLQHNQAAFQI